MASKRSYAEVAAAAARAEANGDDSTASEDGGARSPPRLRPRLIVLNNGLEFIPPTATANQVGAASFEAVEGTGDASNGNNSPPGSDSSTTTSTMEGGDTSSSDDETSSSSSDEGQVVVEFVDGLEPADDNSPPPALTERLFLDDDDDASSMGDPGWAPSRTSSAATDPMGRGNNGTDTQTNNPTHVKIPLVQFNIRHGGNCGIEETCKTGKQMNAGILLIGEIKKPAGMPVRAVPSE